MHRKCSIEFIAGLAGQRDPPKVENHSHCTTIKSAVDILCAMPEVRDSLLAGVDGAGIKAAYM